MAFYVGPESKSLSSLLQMPVTTGVGNGAQLASLLQAAEGQPGERVNILVGIKVPWSGDRSKLS